MQEKNKQYIYVFDPLCAWCNAFASELSQLHAAHPHPIEVLVGGLYVGDRTGVLPEVHPEYLAHLQEVEGKVPGSIGEPLLKAVAERPSDFMMDSMPPSVAFSWLKQHAPHRQFEVAHRIQDLFFKEGKSLGTVENYRPIVEDLGLNFDPFASIFFNPDSEKLAHQQMVTAHKMGLQNFPSLVYVHDRQGELIAQGFREFVQMDRVLKEISSEE